MKPKIGLALSGGGAKGFAHVGVIKSLEKHKIKVSAISGVSAGATVGGIYASGTSIEEIERLCKTTNLREILRLFFDPSKKPGGLITGLKIKNFIKPHIKKEKIEDFPIKFGCVGVDLLTGEAFYFKKGDASIAIMASIAIPGVFKPVIHDGKYFVDGGVLEPIALNLIRELGGEVNIGVDLANFQLPSNENNEKVKITLKNSLVISLNLMQKRLADLEFKNNSDFLRIIPDVKKIHMFSFGSRKIAEETIKEGERVMDENIPKLRQMIKDYREKRFE